MSPGANATVSADRIGMRPRLDCAPARRATRFGIPVGEPHPLRGHPIEVRHFDTAIESVRGRVAPTHVVRHENDYVWCTFHVLRHTHAALLIAQGEHPKVIQERLGHASIKTTLDTYGHLFDGLDEAAAERLDASWRDPRVDALWTQRGRDVIELPSR